MFLNVRKRGQLANQSQKFQIAKSETDWFLIKNVSINYLITRNQNCSFVSNSTSKYTYKIAVIFRFRLPLDIYTKSTSILPALKYTSPSKPQFQLNAVIVNHIPLTKSLKKNCLSQTAKSLYYQVNCGIFKIIRFVYKNIIVSRNCQI